MSAVTKLRRLAEHRERVAKLELANAERERADQERVVAQTTDALVRALDSQGSEPVDHLHRHGYALRMEMVRRGAEHRLIERQREVGQKRDLATSASRERGTLDRILEIEEAALFATASRLEQNRLDETGLMAWWRRAS